MISWSYVTGFFEADGSIYKSDKYWRLNVTNYEEDIIDKIYNFLKENDINVKRYDKSKYGKGYEVRVNSQQDVRRMITHMLRHSQLGYKHKLMLEALQKIDKK